MSLGGLGGIMGGSMGGYDLNDLLSMGIQGLVGMFVQQFMWLVIIVSIPALVYAILQCFFGLKIYRVMLVINGVLYGGAFGAVLFALIFKKVPLSIIGFLLLGALFGVGAWFLYKVFLFLYAFIIGMGIGISFGALVGSVPVGILVGLFLGIALGVLICIFTKWLIMGTTAYQGASVIANVFSLLAISTSFYKPLQYILLVLFAAGGFAVQFFMDKKKPVNIGGKQSYQPAPGMAPVQQPYMQQQYMQQPQPVQQFTPQPQFGQCRLVGVDGLYKGSEFPIDGNIIMGRDVNRCNIIFPEGTAGVSKVQCELQINPTTGAVSIVDNFSSYGTSVNGVKLERGSVRYLNPGDVIMFGENNVFKLEY